jgi:pectinesterase
MRRPPKPKRAAAAATFLLSLSLLLLPLGFVATHRAFSGGVAAASTSTAKRVLLGDDAHANAAANADAAEHAVAVERHCAGTLHRDVCASTLATIPDLAQKPVRDVISAVVARAAAAVRASASNCSAYLRRPAGAGALRVRDRLALSDCVELLGHTLAQLGTAEAELSSAGNRTSTDEESVAGVQTVLSAALTNQYTCLDGFAGPSASEDGRVRPYIQGRIYHVAHLVSNSLAMLRRLPQRRRRGREALELEGYGRVRRGFPSWVSAADRRRLQQQVVVPDRVATSRTWRSGARRPT